MVRDYSQKTVQELYETIRVNVDKEEQWKVFDFVEDFFLEELEIGDYINDINSYHLHMFDKHDVTTKKFDAIVEKAGKVDANYAAQIEGYCSNRCGGKSGGSGKGCDIANRSGNGNDFQY